MSENHKMCNRRSQESTIDVNITDIVLTPLTCASLVNEIIKCLVYGKSQIPYPYTWLKSVVNRKRKSSDNEGPQKNVNFTVERHYREVSSAYGALEDIMNNITKEFGDSNNNINEIVLLFGSTLYTIKEMFRIKIPHIAQGHIENNHLSIAYRNQHKILRDIFFSQDWMDAMEVSMSPTNMFVLLKKNVKTDTDNSSFFNLNRQYSVSKKAHSTIISLNYSRTVQPTCCNNLSVFRDTPHKATDKNEDMDCSENVSDYHWYEAKSLFKGFKDCYIDKTSASELW